MQVPNGTQTYLPYSNSYNAPGQIDYRSHGNGMGNGNRGGRGGGGGGRGRGEGAARGGSWRRGAPQNRGFSRPVSRKDYVLKVLKWIA